MELIKKDVKDYSIMVYVKSINRKTYVLYTDKQELVADFMKRHFEQANIPLIFIEKTRIIVNGRRLAHEQLMGEAEIERESMISFFISDVGGAPKPYSEKPKEPKLGLF
jgi:hypothetical protein